MNAATWFYLPSDFLAAFINGRLHRKTFQTCQESIGRSSDGLLTCLNLAADIKFDWSPHQLSKQPYAGHCAMILPHLCRVTANVRRANQCPIIKRTSERWSKSASVLCGHATSPPKFFGTRTAIRERTTPDIVDSQIRPKLFLLFRNLGVWQIENHGFRLNTGCGSQNTA